MTNRIAEILAASDEATPFRDLATVLASIYAPRKRDLKVAECLIHTAVNQGVIEEDESKTIWNTLALWDGESPMRQVMLTFVLQRLLLVWIDTTLNILDPYTEG